MQVKIGVTFLISFTIRTCSINNPERSPASPRRCPAIERSWHGLPPQMMSTIGSSAPLSFVISPTWSILGNLSDVTFIGNFAISLAHKGSIPLCCAASGNPPIPSKRLPIFGWLSVRLLSSFPESAALQSVFHFFFAIDPSPSHPNRIFFAISFSCPSITYIPITG